VPIYEYQCGACAHHLEKLQKMSEDRLVDCPECGQPALKRLVSAAAFRLKGSGWYETDFKQDNKRNLAEDSSKETSDKKSSDSNGKKPEKAASETSTSKKESSPPSKPAAKSASKESSHA
jgi:putative FmdB family regulatory protein